MRQSWSRSVKFWQRYENQQIQCISPSKPVRFASFLFHCMRKRNIRTLLYYTFLWMWAILTWKMENYMDRNYYCAPGNWIGPSQIELDGRTFISQLYWVGSAYPWWNAPGDWIGWSRLPGIESLGWSGKMSEAVASSNLFKWTQPTHGHSNGPGDLYFWPSLGQFHRTHWLHSLKTCLKMD